MIISLCVIERETSCTNGDVRIWNGVGLPDNEGIAQICRGNTWYALCDNGGCNTAKLVCKSLGYSGLIGKHRKSVIVFQFPSY